MALATLMTDHLYLAILLGSLLEGETSAILAGYAAHQGYASWPTVILIVAAINFTWDQCFFWLGLRFGGKMIQRFGALERGVARVAPLIQRRRRWIVFGIRFMYGLRTAGPFALGMVGIPWREFVLFNALGALVWAGFFTGLGFVFGRLISTAIGEATKYEMLVLIVVVFAGFAHWAWRRAQQARQSKQ